MNQPIPWRRLAAMARPEAARITAGVVSLAIGSGLGLAYPQIVKQMVDAVTEGAGVDVLNQAAVALIVVFVVQSVFTGLRAYLFTVAGERVVSKLRSDLFGAVLRQDIAFFDNARTGELTNRLASDTTVLQNAVTANLSMVLRFGAGAFGGAAMLLYTSPVLTGLALLVVPFVAIGGAWYGRLLRRQSKEVQDALAASTTVAEEALSNVRTVRAFAREEHEIGRYRRAVDHSFDLAASRAALYGGFTGVGGFAGYTAIALVVWYGGYLVLNQQMSVGDLTAFLLYTGLVGMSVGALAGVWADLMKAVGASERVFELMDRVPALEGPGGVRLSAVRGEVRFDRVGFSYPSRPDVAVMRGFDLHISPGTAVALVGPSGAGKSTVAALLMRLYDPADGSVSVDGIDVRTVDPRDLREHIGIVSQEPVLFATTIADNIRYGRPGASDAEVEAAARAANAHDFITSFPDGYGTLVGERGVQLSGGQKQRVAIARALLKDPPILVLDEATSALDAASERLVQDALDRLMRGRTTLIIAHRLSTVKNADRVVVVDGGQVAEQGTHADLVAQDGVYRRLVQHQFAGDVA